jgi:hypothetical protein
MLPSLLGASEGSYLLLLTNLDTVKKQNTVNYQAKLGASEGSYLLSLIIFRFLDTKIIC